MIFVVYSHGLFKRIINVYIYDFIPILCDPVSYM
jgi:hypothetical protein